VWINFTFQTVNKHNSFSQTHIIKPIKTKFNSLALVGNISRYFFLTFRSLLTLLKFLHWNNSKRIPKTFGICSGLGCSMECFIYIHSKKSCCCSILEKAEKIPKECLKIPAFPKHCWRLIVFSFFCPVRAKVSLCERMRWKLWVLRQVWTLEAGKCQHLTYFYCNVTDSTREKKNESKPNKSTKYCYTMKLQWWSITRNFKAWNFNVYSFDIK